MAVTIARSMKPCIVTVVGQAVGSVVTIASGRRQGSVTFEPILCACNARQREDLWRQLLSTTSSHTVVTQPCSGTKRTGRAFASLVMIKKHGTKIKILLIGSDWKGVGES